jgi:ABC-type Zn2+ transport system substrate-binding protein/surface adhesin
METQHEKNTLYKEDQHKHQFVEKHKRKFTSEYTLPLLLNQGDGTKLTTVKTVFKKLNAPKKKCYQSNSANYVNKTLETLRKKIKQNLNK